MGRTPARTRKAKNQVLKSTLETVGDANFARCPSGHPLPHKTERGRCTPMYCAEKVDLPRLRHDKDDEPAEVRVAKVTGDEELRVKVQSARRTVWQNFLQIPVDLKGADAEKYADEELVSMLPFAVGVLKKQLLFGTEEQQTQASYKVLDANGKGKRESAGNSAPSIIINLPGGVGVGGQIALPWRSLSTVEGSSVTVNEPKALPVKTEKK